MQRSRGIYFIGLPHGHAKGGSPKKTGFSLAYWENGLFGYDGLGNVTSQKAYEFHTLTGECEDGSRYDEYDKVSRLKSLTTETDEAVSAYAYQAAYVYDAFGNMISQTLDGDTYSYAIDTPTNQLSSVLYDTAGNQESWGAGTTTYTYGYTPFHQINRYTADGRSQYAAFSADNERMITYDTVEGDIVFVLRDLDAKVLRMLHLEDSILEWNRDYLYRGRTLVGAKSPEMDFRLFVDHLGSVRLVTGWSEWGAIIELNNYSPFGSEWTSDVLGTDQKLRFTGHERDLMDPTHTTDDLDCMHARHYNLNLARFLSVDPIGGDPLVPQSWNGYSYVLNNPLKYTDPYGLEPTGQAVSCYGDGAGGDSVCFDENSLSTWGRWILERLLGESEDDEDVEKDDDPFGTAELLETYYRVDGSNSNSKRASHAFPPLGT
ncbi:MAG: RHS repeat-associated core domain-containing protein [Thermoanaerobaculales bacterium]|nr:RHS repeat-associated core domain-containing protein [Thermoanaerobaculales bacterium]